MGISLEDRVDRLARVEGSGAEAATVAGSDAPRVAVARVKAVSDEKSAPTTAVTANEISPETAIETGSDLGIKT
jgi:hypothetical protein